MRLSRRRAGLLLRTARRFRLRQLLYWGLRRIQREFGPGPKEFESAAWDLPALDAVGAAVREWGPDDLDARMNRAERAVEGNVTIYGRDYRLGPTMWNGGPTPLDRQAPHHCAIAYDLAWAGEATHDPRFAQTLVRVFESWHDCTTPGQEPAWEPYPTAVRITNWIYALALSRERLPPELLDHLGGSVQSQARWLSARLEHHVSGNHLQRNYQALALAGATLVGRRAAGLHRRGVRGLERQWQRQVLSDGGHYERSSMYHLLFLADGLEYLAWRRWLGRPVGVEMRQVVSLCGEAGWHFFRSDGTIHLLADSAQEVAPSINWIGAALRRECGRRPNTPDGAWALPAMGYCGVRDDKNRESLLIDAGPFGASDQPGHGHCDALSYELDLGGRPIVVDSGVAGYQGHALREYVRSTRAHNTVAISGREQSEIWGAFRVGRMASVVRADVSVLPGKYRFDGSVHHHHGVIHHRTLEWQGLVLTVRDTVEGYRSEESVVTWLHLHPTFAVTTLGNNWVARDHQREILIRPIGATRVTAVRGGTEPYHGWYCHRFGEAVPAWCLGVEVSPYDGRELGYELCAIEDHPG